MANKNKPQSWSKKRNLQAMTAQSRFKDVMKLMKEKEAETGKVTDNNNTPSFKKLLKASFNKKKESPNE